MESLIDMLDKIPRTNNTLFSLVKTSFFFLKKCIKFIITSIVNKQVSHCINIVYLKSIYSQNVIYLEN